VLKNVDVAESLALWYGLRGVGPPCGVFAVAFHFLLFFQGDSP
jgi:hypothetical protein